MTSRVPDELHRSLQIASPLLSYSWIRKAGEAGSGSGAYSEAQQAGFVDTPGAPGAKPSDLQQGADQKRYEADAADVAINKGIDSATEFAANKIAKALSTAIDRLADKVVAQVEDKLRMGK